MGKEADAQALQTERYRTLDLIDEERLSHHLGWELIGNAVTAASETVSKVRSDVIEKRIAQLAESTYPTLLETVLGMVVSMIPVSTLLEGLFQHMGRSFRLGGIVGYLNKHGDVVTLKPEWAKFYTRLRQDKPMTFLKDTRKWVSDIVEYDEAILKYTAKIKPALEGTIKQKLGAAASAAGKPTVSQEQLFSQTAPVKRASTSVTAAPDFLLHLRDWVSMAQHADDVAYGKLRTGVDRSQDIEPIKAAYALVAEQAATGAGGPKQFDRDALRKAVEICIFCMTWDFRPRFVPMKRSNTIGQLMTRGAIQPAFFELPPLGDEFWNFATDRYLDPFTGDGTKTYAEVGRSRSLGGGGTPVEDPELQRYMKNTPGWDQGFYPAERLAYDFGNVIAPQLFGMNIQIAQLLEGKITRRGPQSRPTELDTFYSYLLGYRPLEPAAK
jgi:hypothetical protein